MDIGPVTADQLFKEINARIPSFKDKIEILQLCLDRIINLLKANRGFILLHDHSTGRLRVDAFHNIDPGYLFLGETISMTIINRTYLQEEALLVADALADPSFAKTASIVLSDLRSVICVPLADEKGVYGIIYIDNRFKVNYYMNDHLQFIKECAGKITDFINKHLPEIQPRARS